MLLAVDIGNTTVAIAGLEGEQAAFVKRLPSDPGLDWTAALRQLLEGAFPLFIQRVCYIW